MNRGAETTLAVRGLIKTVFVIATVAPCLPRRREQQAGSPARYAAYSIELASTA
jgi:hypothetical protein